MNEDWSVLRSPVTGDRLLPQDDFLLDDTGRRYPIVKGIPRFVGPANYADDFGFQWNRFRETQLDSHTGLRLSEARLGRCLNGHIDALKGKKILEAGSGAGRFTEVLLKFGAVVHSFDYSAAVEANAANNAESAKLTLVQADIEQIPFEKGAYDYVVCLGVLQHTPSPEKSITNLWTMLKPGGALVIDHYLWRARQFLPPPIGNTGWMFRLLVLRLPSPWRFKFIKLITDLLFPLQWAFRDNWLIRRVLRGLSPVHFYYPEMKLSNRTMYYEWALLDTHDALTDVYKHHRTLEQVRSHLEHLDASEIAICEGGNGIEAFCRKKSIGQDPGT